MFIAGILFWIFIFSLLSGCASADSLGKNEQEFQATKAKISKAIEGTGATLSEVKVPKLTEEEMNRINQAIKELNDNRISEVPSSTKR